MLIFEGMLCFLRTPVVMSNCNLFAFYSCAKDGVRWTQTRLKAPEKPRGGQFAVFIKRKS